MKALLFDGAASLRDMADAVAAELERQLLARGDELSRRDLTGLAIPDCQGDFGCWTATPGECVHPGPHRELARELAQSDLAVWLTPVTFGGYSAPLKRLLDHCIPLISPRFTTRFGETRHEPRYERAPALLAVGLMEQASAEPVRVFQRLARRNALNIHAPCSASAVMTRDELPWRGTHVAAWLESLRPTRPCSAAEEAVDIAPEPDLPPVRPRRAALLVGSPRGRDSVSAQLAVHLARLLQDLGVEVATEWLHREMRADPRLGGLAAWLRAADLVVLSAPLYVDSLPAPVTAALETLAGAWDGSRGSPPRFLAMVNCGFPEAAHAETAVAIGRLFARQAGLPWVGGLAIGGGGMLAGAPLANQGGRTRNVTRALALTANAVASGRVIPDEAQRLVATLAIPPWMYRTVANWGFRREAKKRGTLRRLGARPYARTSAGR